MRKLKFRAWDGEKMVSPQSVDRNGVAWWRENSIPTTCKNVMQFTGLVDKNGKEIYEGDICFADSKEYARNKQVVWNERLACFEFDYPLGKSLLQKDSIEIIGNVYENPELLNQ